MGGENASNDARAAASALAWWLESGVDVAVQDEPRNWFAPSSPSTPPTIGPSTPAADVVREPLPETLDLFRDWLARAPDLPLASPGAPRILPKGGETPAIMLIADAPGIEEEAAAAPVAGASAELMERMLRAIGLSTERAYVSPIACFHSPGQRIDAVQLEACAEIARHQIRLLKPPLLLLLGQAPTRALLGKSLRDARGHVHRIEGVRTVATFHPRHLLAQRIEKAQAWRDLMLLTEEDS